MTLCRAAGKGAGIPVLLALSLWAAFTSRCDALEINVQGVPSDIEDAVTNAIVVGSGEEDRAADRDEALRHMRRGREQLERAMRSFGYYRARVEARLSGERPEWRADYQVTPGEQLTYRSVTLEISGPGESDPALSGYLAGRPLKAGDPVNHARYESVKQELLKRTLSRGYLDASLSERRVEVDLDAYHADARIVVDTGPLYSFGEIRLHQDVLDEAFVRRFITIDPGERYANQRLLELEQDLRDSDYFADIRVEPRLDEAGEDGRVPVDVHLSASDPSEWQAGAGFGTDTGLRGSLSWEQRRLNKRGHRLGSSARLSEIGGSVEGHYIIPFGDPRQEQYELFAGYSEDNPDTSDSQLGQVGIRRSTAMGRTRLDLSFTYQREDFRVAGQSGLTDLFIPGVALSRVTADNRLFTRNGQRWRAAVQGAAGLISDFAFIQPRVSGKLIRSFGDARVILRGEAAWTAAQLEDLPASLRFFAGGDQSVRGFDYETLGPENEEGDVTGGRQLLVGSVEVDYGVTDKWRVAGFVDAGNAFDEFNEPLRKSVGVGIRRITPIGPIRVDLAHPLSGGEDDFRLHVTIGPDL